MRILRRVLVALMCFPVLGSAPVLAAQAGASVGEVTSVTIGWADSMHRAVRVTWTETSALPNHVEVRYGTSDSGFPEYYTTEVQDNTIDIPVDAFAIDLTAAVAVSIGDPTTPDSGTLRSESFDTNTLPWPTTTGIVAAHGFTTWTWTAVVPGPDSTPDDPLDLATSVRYQPLRSSQQSMVPAGPATTARMFRIADPGDAYRLGAAALNEWRPVADGIEAHYYSKDVFTALAVLHAPNEARYGARVPIAVVVRYRGFGCTTTCGSIDLGASTGQVVRVEARAYPGGRWSLVSQGSTDRYGAFRTTVGMPGSRQLRAVALTKDSGADWLRGTTSNPRTVIGRTRVLGAKFIDSTVGYGQKAVAYVAVTPGVWSRALLQRRGRDGLYRGIAYVQLSSGRGHLQLVAAPRGTTHYRFVVPATTHRGYQLAAASSASFPLAVR